MAHGQLYRQTTKLPWYNMSYSLVNIVFASAWRIVNLSWPKQPVWAELGNHCGRKRLVIDSPANIETIDKTSKVPLNLKSIWSIRLQMVRFYRIPLQPVFVFTAWHFSKWISINPPFWDRRCPFPRSDSNVTYSDSYHRWKSFSSGQLRVTKKWTYHVKLLFLKPKYSGKIRSITWQLMSCRRTAHGITL